jgi:hypothetical protein
MSTIYITWNLFDRVVKHLLWKKPTGYIKELEDEIINKFDLSSLEAKTIIEIMKVLGYLKLSIDTRNNFETKYKLTKKVYINHLPFFLSPILYFFNNNFRK